MIEKEYLLADETAALEFGRLLARVARTCPGTPPALLLTGPLGAGKTTLVRGLVEALPGADQAEVASPSFNLVNLYPTTPPVAHFDLYRLEEGAFLDDAEEWLGAPGTWCLVEWAERLPARLRPDNALDLAIRSGTGTDAPETGRRVKITAHSKHALAYLAALGEQDHNRSLE